MNEQAVYTHDGYPVNLPAAAYDALHWLRFLRAQADNPLGLTDESRAALGRCTDALEALVQPCLPEVWQKRFPGVVAEIVEPDRKQEATNAA